MSRNTLGQSLLEFFGPLFMVGISLLNQSSDAAIIPQFDQQYGPVVEHVTLPPLDSPVVQVTQVPAFQYPLLSQKQDYLRQSEGVFVQQLAEMAENEHISFDVLKHIMLPNLDGRPLPTARSPKGCSGGWVTFMGSLYYVTADHCMNGIGVFYPIEVHQHTDKAGTVSGQLVYTNRYADISLLRVDERQFRGLPRTFELSEVEPREGEYAIVCGAHASAPGYPGSVNNGVRILRVGRKVANNRWELNDSSHSGHSGGVIVSAKTGKVLGVMSTTDSLGIATFGAVGGLGLKVENQPKPMVDFPADSSDQNNSEVVESSVQLFVVTQPGCKPCDDQKAELEKLGIEYSTIEYTQAIQRGWHVQQTPTIVAADTNRVYAILNVGVAQGDILKEWVRGYVPNAFEEKTADGSSPWTTAAWLTLLICLVFIAVIYIRQQRK